MAQPTNLYDQYDSKGNREDLSDKIYNITPTDSPLMTAIGRNKATAVHHEWQTDTLAAAISTNAAIEGNDATLAEPAATTRVGNRCQILTKVFGISGTVEAINKAGRTSELSYQLAKRSRELKRDLETSLLVNNASVVGDNTTAREMAGFAAWLTSNDNGTAGASPANRGTGGSAGGWGGTVVAAATDGTTRAFTQAMLDGVIQKAWESGGNPSLIMAGASQKTNLSSFVGVATETRHEIKDREIIATADVYVSNFGTLKVVPNRYIRQTSSVDREILGVDPEYACVSYLRPFHQFPIARSGDSEKRQLLCECTLEMKNEAAHFIVADLS